MRLHAYRLKNYRRLRDVVVELDNEISIFVGANNSGKTSAAQGLQMMLEGKRSKFNLFDFSAPLWKTFDEIGNAAPGDVETPVTLPTISLDLWFRVGVHDLVSAMPLLPSTDWEGRFVGIRVSFEPGSAYDVVRRFREKRDGANAAAIALNVAGDDYQPWPQTLTKYLADELANEYELRYYVLDERHFDGFREREVDYDPLPVSGDPGGATILKSLLKVDFLRAQRHLDDPDSDSTGGGGGARDENLSKRLSRFYERNLEKRADDHAMLKALSSSEKGFNYHLQQVFQKTLERLAKLGYPGIKNPEIVIRAQLDPSKVLNQDATRVHYVLPGDDKAELPDSYNGLGYKNLIYMVVELLDLHERWKDDEANRPPLHLIFIEEPEAHLHAQVQQVFIRNVLTLLEQDNDDDGGVFATQLVVTTHSPHILYERGFAPIRYFRRGSEGLEHFTEVKNLSRFKATENEKASREFLQRYLKLTHCDLFFSDAAILVEGNVERLLMPAMIESSAKRLRSSALTILEVGGAFAHRFKELIEFVGITTLVITDIDSVLPKPDADPNAENDNEGPEDDDYGEDSPKTFEIDDGEDDNGNKKLVKKSGSTCFAEEPGALTANQTLINWIPQKRSVTELLEVGNEGKILALPNAAGALVRIAYQVRIPVTVGGVTESLCGRTLEEAFGLENAAWSQEKANQGVGLRLRRVATTPRELAQGLHKRVIGKNFDKTKFALEVLASGSEGSWKVPRYIADGLRWLEGQVAHEAEAEVVAVEASEAMLRVEATAEVALEAGGAVNE